MERDKWELCREMEDGGKDPGYGMAFFFTNEETKVQVSNSRSGFASL